ncbi:dihydrodipicolinate synthase family protein [Streptomyces orinoci]|uniref:Dihydrodipicolinate synthase family protein n=1 Tax=Streptomyces orinoci TaxID=67339 RepID=A0ABV3K483_STRON|nr:dihydrodipicolinate synthase family protein [Streptomyces orinoci]
MNPQLTGIVPPLCTPFTRDGEVDTTSLAALVARALDAGASAVFALGTCGEAVFLTDAQRRTVLDTVVQAAAGRAPVLAGVIDMTTPRVLVHARAAAEAGAAALVATAPFYTGTHPAETAGHFRRIRGAAGLPLLAYDIPAAVHSGLPAATLLTLAEEGVLAGLKDSSGDLGALRRLLLALRERGLQDTFSVLTGSELIVDGALLAGVQGVVPGLGNIDPGGYVRLYRHARAGRWPAAAAEQDRLTALFALVDAGAGTPPGMSGSASALAGYKTALHLLGVIGHPATATGQVLPEPAVRTVRTLLAGAGLL